MNNKEYGIIFNLHLHCGHAPCALAARCIMASCMDKVSTPIQGKNTRVRLMADPLAGEDEGCLLHQHHGLDGGELPSVSTDRRHAIHIDARGQILPVGGGIPHRRMASIAHRSVNEHGKQIAQRVVHREMYHTVDRYSVPDDGKWVAGLGWFWKSWKSEGMTSASLLSGGNVGRQSAKKRLLEATIVRVERHGDFGERGSVGVLSGQGHVREGEQVWQVQIRRKRIECLQRPDHTGRDAEGLWCCEQHLDILAIETHAIHVVGLNGIHVRQRRGRQFHSRQQVRIRSEIQSEGNRPTRKDIAELVLIAQP